jgi:hypothetical protein
MWLFDAKFTILWYLLVCSIWESHEINRPASNLMKPISAFYLLETNISLCLFVAIAFDAMGELDVIDLVCHRCRTTRIRLINLGHGHVSHISIFLVSSLSNL